MDSIMKRRSIRKYTGEKISKEKVLKLLEAAMSAPSAGNEKPWEFIVVQEQSVLHKLADVSPYSKMLEHAAVAIIVLGDKSKTRFGDFWIQDCSAATQNILVEAVEQELGGVWLGVFPDPSRVEFIRKLFSLPEDITPFSLIPIGYPAEQFPHSSRFDAKRVHWERW
jgi:nitroreductase